MVFRFFRTTTNPFTSDLEEAIEYGAKWMREQMMKEAVEGVVYNALLHNENNVFVQSDEFPKGQFNPCDRVKFIIIKED